jgi:hypothetical protein
LQLVLDFTSENVLDKLDGLSITAIRVWQTQIPLFFGNNINLENSQEKNDKSGWQGSGDIHDVSYHRGLPSLSFSYDGCSEAKQTLSAEYVPTLQSFLAFCLFFCEG